MGSESVILCRDQDGAGHVFLNSCRHRGMKICRYGQGNTSWFVCPYHSWSDTADGRLQGVPLYRVLYDGTLNRDEWSLIEVAGRARCKDTVWASWDPEVPEFLTYLGDAVDHLDQVLDCRDGRPGGSEVIGMHKWILPASWKFAAGHGVHSVLTREDPEYGGSYQQYPEVDAHFRQCFEDRKRRFGDRARLLPFTGNIFPNTSYHGRQPRGICVWHRHGATEAEARGDDRAGRHGELALCHRRQPGPDRPSSSVQRPAVDGRQPHRHPAAGRRLHPDDGTERPQLLPCLSLLHGGSALAGPARPSRRARRGGVATMGGTIEHAPARGAPWWTPTQDVAEFLYREADLLDDRPFPE